MTPLGPARAVGGAVAPDGSYVVAESEEIIWRFPAGGGAPMRIPEIERDLEFVGWSNDSQPFLARNSPGGGKEIFYAPMGKPKQKLTEIAIADQAALNRFYVADVVGDARQFGYVYGFGRELSTLIVGSGIVVR